MQKEGKVRFLKYHEKAVKSVSYNPKERYIFCSCSSDGKVGASIEILDDQQIIDFDISSRSSRGLNTDLPPLSNQINIYGSYNSSYHYLLVSYPFNGMQFRFHI